MNCNFINDTSIIDERIKWCQENFIGDVTYEIDENNRLIAHGDIIFVDDQEEVQYKIDELFGSFITENAKNMVRGNLKSMKNMPDIIHGKFDVSLNPNITSLEGGPSKVYGSYKCSNCNIASLKGIATYITGSLQLFNNNIDCIDLLDQIYVGKSILVEGNPILSKSNPTILKKLLENRQIQIDK